MRIAFYAPLKAPDHPIASGDRLIAGLLVRALERAGHQVVVASRLRTFDGAGNPRRQLGFANAAKAQARALQARWLDSPQAPECWFTYHLYHKAPDWIGPRVSAWLGIPYVVAEASHAPKQARGAWRHGHRAVEAALVCATRLIALNPDDVPGLEGFLGTGASIVQLPPFLDVSALTPPGARARRRARIARLVGAAPADPLLVCVAMMRRGRKADSFRLLARALERAIADLRWRLLVVGGGPARDEVRNRVREGWKRAGRVAFLGTAVAAGAATGSSSACDLFVWPALGGADRHGDARSPGARSPGRRRERRAGWGPSSSTAPVGGWCPRGMCRHSSDAGGARPCPIAPPWLAVRTGEGLARVSAPSMESAAAARSALDRWIGEAVAECRR